MKDQSKLFSTFLLLFFAQAPIIAAHTKEKSLFRTNCLSVDKFLSTYTEFRPEKEDIQTDELLQLLDAKYLRSNVNLYLPKGKESDVFFDIYNDLVEEEHTLPRSSMKSAQSKEKGIWVSELTRDNSYALMRVDGSQTSVRKGGLIVSQNSELESELSGSVRRPNGKLSSYNSQRDIDEDLSIENPYHIQQQAVHSKPSQKNNESENRGHRRILTKTSNKLELESSVLRLSSMGDLSMRQNSNPIYNLNRKQMEKDFREQLNSFDEDNMVKIQSNHDQVFGLTQEFLTLTESLRKKDFKRMAAIYHLFFEKYNADLKGGQTQGKISQILIDVESNHSAKKNDEIGKIEKRGFEKRKQLERLASVKNCIYDPGVPGVGSQFGFLSQSLISLEYYFEMKGAYQWIIAKVFLDVAESLEFVFSEGFYLKKLGRSDIGLLAKKEINDIDMILLEVLNNPKSRWICATVVAAHDHMVSQIILTEEPPSTSFNYIGGFKNISDLSQDQNPLELTKKHIKNSILLFHAFTVTIELTHLQHFGYSGIDLTSCLKDGLALEFKELCPVFIWNALNKDPKIKTFFALALELTEAGKTDFDQSPYISQRDIQFLKKILRILIIGFKKMMILVIKTEHDLKISSNGLGSGFFRDFNDEAGRLVREKQKEIDMDEMMSEMYEGPTGSQKSIDSGLEVRSGPTQRGNVVGTRHIDSPIENDSPRNSPIQKKMPSPFQLDDDFSDVIDEVDIQFGDHISECSAENLARRSTVISDISQNSHSTLHSHFSKTSIEFATELNLSINESEISPVLLRSQHSKKMDQPPSQKDVDMDRPRATLISGVRRTSNLSQTRTISGNKGDLQYNQAQRRIGSIDSVRDTNALALDENSQSFESDHQKKYSIYHRNMDSSQDSIDDIESQSIDSESLPANQILQRTKVSKTFETKYFLGARQTPGLMSPKEYPKSEIKNPHLASDQNPKKTAPGAKPLHLRVKSMQARVQSNFDQNRAKKEVSDVQENEITMNTANPKTLIKFRRTADQHPTPNPQIKEPRLKKFLARAKNAAGSHNISLRAFLESSEYPLFKPKASEKIEIDPVNNTAVPGSDIIRSIEQHPKLKYSVNSKTRKADFLSINSIQRIGHPLDKKGVTFRSIGPLSHSPSNPHGVFNSNNKITKIDSKLLDLSLGKRAQQLQRPLQGTSSHGSHQNSKINNFQARLDHSKENPSLPGNDSKSKIQSTPDSLKTCTFAPQTKIQVTSPHPTQKDPNRSTRSHSHGLLRLTHSNPNLTSVREFRENGSVPDLSRYFRNKSETRIYVEKAFLNRLKIKIQQMKSQQKKLNNNSAVKEEVQKIMGGSIQEFEKKVDDKMKLNLRLQNLILEQKRKIKDSNTTGTGYRSRKCLLLI